MKADAPYKKKSVGAWTQYHRQLEPLRSVLQKYLPDLAKSDALPYKHIMNWDLNANFDCSSYMLDQVTATNIDTTCSHRE